MKWIDIPGYEGRYRISSDGQVYSCLNKKVLAPRLHTQGYMRVHLSHADGNRRDHYIHRLVLFAFKGTSRLREVNHINGDKTDNRLSNLEYCSSSANKAHAWANGMYTHKGERHYSTKLTEETVRKIKLSAKTSPSRLAKELGVPRRTVRNILNGVSWAWLEVG